MNDNSLSLSLIVIALLASLSAPFYPEKLQEKVFDFAQKILLIGATVLQTKNLGDKKGDKTDA